MGAFIAGMSRKDREAFVAAALNFPPDQPETWPHALIDQILHDAEKAADRRLDESVLMFLPALTRNLTHRVTTR